MPTWLIRWGAIAIGALLLTGAAAAWWTHIQGEWLDRGRAIELSKQLEANRVAENKRRAEISSYVADHSARETDLRTRLAAAESTIDLRTDALQKASSNVTPRANQLCSLTRGFVRDHDAAVPGAAGSSAVPARGPDVDEPARVPLTAAANVIVGNYGECGKCVKRLDACEERRYEACVAWDRTFGTKSNCTR